ncbi:hypothetical protein HK099_001346 [Clydaea vesicula]|uniref:Uncharacterized protein n=1 Tax=Clydaea vesicula TaxID=447962 RepID=A0AAD5U825_9FUNG|nr:hypothetical protein HK099_001346 [Clydaea vesicula]
MPRVRSQSFTKSDAQKAEITSTLPIIEVENVFLQQKNLKSNKNLNEINPAEITVPVIADTKKTLKKNNKLDNLIDNYDDKKENFSSVTVIEEVEETNQLRNDILTESTLTTESVPFQIILNIENKKNVVLIEHKDSLIFNADGMLLNTDFDSKDFDALQSFAEVSCRFQREHDSSPTSSNYSNCAVHELIEKFLELPRPILHDSLVECLILDGKGYNVYYLLNKFYQIYADMVEVFVNFIVRPNINHVEIKTKLEKIINSTKENCDSKRSLNDLETSKTLTEKLTNVNYETSRKEIEEAYFNPFLEERDTSDVEAGRKGYNALNILCEYTGPALFLLNETLPRIVKQMITIFDTGSKGSFRHFRKFLFEISARQDAIIDIILMENSLISKKPYLIEMLNYCHEPAIQDSILRIIFHQNNVDNLQAQVNRYEKIRDLGFLKVLLNLCQVKCIESLLFTFILLFLGKRLIFSFYLDSPRILAGAADLLVRIIQEASFHESSIILFQYLLNDLLNDTSIPESEGSEIESATVLNNIDLEKINFLTATSFDFNNQDNDFIKNNLNEFISSFSKNDIEVSELRLIIPRFKIFVDIVHSLFCRSISESVNIQINQTFSNHPLQLLKTLVFKKLLQNSKKFIELAFFQNHYKFLTHFNNVSEPGTNSPAKTENTGTGGGFKAKKIHIKNQSDNNQSIGDNCKAENANIEYIPNSTLIKLMDIILEMVNFGEEFGEDIQNFMDESSSKFNEIICKQDADIYFLKSIPFEIILNWFHTTLRNNSMYSLSTFKLLKLLILKRKRYFKDILIPVLFGWIENEMEPVAPLEEQNIQLSKKQIHYAKKDISDSSSTVQHSRKSSNESTCKRNRKQKKKNKNSKKQPQKEKFGKLKLNEKEEEGDYEEDNQPTICEINEIASEVDLELKRAEYLSKFGRGGLIDILASEFPFHGIESGGYMLLLCDLLRSAAEEDTKEVEELRIELDYQNMEETRNTPFNLKHYLDLKQNWNLNLNNFVKLNKSMEKSIYSEKMTKKIFPQNTVNSIQENYFFDSEPLPSEAINLLSEDFNKEAILQTIQDFEINNQFSEESNIFGDTTMDSSPLPPTLFSRKKCIEDFFSQWNRNDSVNVDLMGDNLKEGNRKHENFDSDANSEVF